MITTRQVVTRLAAFAFVVGLSAAIFVFRDSLRELAVYGYAGVFAFAVLTNATVVLPAPGLIVIYAMGASLNPIGVGLAAGLGSSLGELSSYVVGYSGRAAVEHNRTYDRIKAWMVTHDHSSGWLLMLLAFLPLSLFDLAGIAAGALRMSVWKFLAWATPGKILKMLLVAHLGRYSVHWFGF